MNMDLACSPRLSLPVRVYTFQGALCTLRREQRPGEDRLTFPNYPLMSARFGLGLSSAIRFLLVQPSPLQFLFAKVIQA